MSVYSTLLATFNTTTAQVTYYTVPAGTTVVIRDIEATDFSGVANTLFIQIGVTGFTQTVIEPQTSASVRWVQWKGRLVLPAGGILQSASSSAGHSVAVSGYLLS